MLCPRAMQCSLMFRYVSHTSYMRIMFLMGLIIFCVQRIVAQSSFPKLFAMRHHMKPAQQAELARREAKAARQEQQEDITDVSETQLEDIGPMFLSAQQEELEREAKAARREQQEDMADLSESQPQDIGPMFLRSYVLKMFCAWIGMG